MRKGNSLTITRKKDAKNNPKNNLAQFVDNYLKKKKKTYLKMLLLKNPIFSFEKASYAL